MFLGSAHKFPIYEGRDQLGSFSKTSGANPSAYTHIPRILWFGMMKASFLAASAAFITLASAQQTVWGQCGGINWTGPTTCAAGSYCAVQNPWYYQCLPGTATTTAATPTSTSTKSSSTTKPATTLTTSTTTKPPTTTSKPTTSTTSTSSKPATTTATGSTGGYVTTSGLEFVINGKKGYFAGTNSYWIAFLTNNADIDLVMTHLVASGLKVLRVWGFNDVTAVPGTGTVWFQSFVSGQTPVINTGTDGLQRLDYVVSSAESHGIKLIINFVNNWNDYGGMAAYSGYCGSTATTWYTNTCAQTQYKTYISTVVARYKTSTAVFAWELANEPRCNGCATSVITTWATTISAYIKSLDSNHLVTIGDEGFGVDGGTDTSYPFTLGEGLNFTTNLAIPTIDFGTFHLYPGSWGEADSWGSSWITDHGKVAAALGKPVILEEYGSTTHTNELPWQATVVADNNIAGDMFWQYGDTLSIGQTSNDGYSLYYGTSEYTTLVTNHAAAMNAK